MDNKKYVSTGLRDLDNALGGGFQPGGLYVLGGRPAMGKSALALNIVCNAIEKEIKVTYFSLEMSKDQLTKRLLYTIAMEPFPRPTDVPTEGVWNKKMEASNKICGSKLIIDDTPAISIEELREKTFKMSSYLESDLILVDYLQILDVADRSKFDNYEQIKDYILKELKKMAADSNIPVLAISQIIDPLRLREDPHPILSDFWKIEISNIADVAMLLYRDEYYNKDTELKNIAEITIAHNNFGPCSHTECAYLPEYLRFANLEKR